MADPTSTETLVTTIGGTVGAVITAASLLVRRLIEAKQEERAENKAADKPPLDDATIDRVAERVLALVRQYYGDRASAFFRHFEKVENTVESIDDRTDEIQNSARTLSEIAKDIAVLKDRTNRKE